MNKLKLMTITVFIAINVFFSSFAFAGYNANFKGKITHVLTYTYSTQILVRVEGQPSSHPECSRFDYLIVDPATPDNIREMVLSRLLTAYATGEVVNIGYDKDSSCVSGRIKIFRVG